MYVQVLEAKKLQLEKNVARAVQPAVHDFDLEPARVVDPHDEGDDSLQVLQIFGVPDARWWLRSPAVICLQT